MKKLLQPGCRYGYCAQLLRPVSQSINQLHAIMLIINASEKYWYNCAGLVLYNSIYSISSHVVCCVVVRTSLTKIHFKSRSTYKYPHVSVEVWDIIDVHWPCDPVHCHLGEWSHGGVWGNVSQYIIDYVVMLQNLRGSCFFRSFRSQGLCKWSWKD